MISRRCSDHPDSKSFSIETNLKNITTRGLSFFVCNEQGCNQREIVDQPSIFECPKHQQPIELRVNVANHPDQETSQKFLYRCRNSKENVWCGNVICKSGFLPFRPFNFQSTSSSNFSSPLLDPLIFGSRTLFTATSTPLNRNQNDDQSVLQKSTINHEKSSLLGVSKKNVRQLSGKANFKPKNTLLANFEESSCSDTSHHHRLSEDNSGTVACFGAAHEKETTERTESTRLTIDQHSAIDPRIESSAGFSSTTSGAKKLASETNSSLFIFKNDSGDGKFLSTENDPSELLNSIYSDVLDLSQRQRQENASYKNNDFSFKKSSNWLYESKVSDDKFKNQNLKSNPAISINNSHSIVVDSTTTTTTTESKHRSKRNHSKTKRDQSTSLQSSNLATTNLLWLTKTSECCSSNVSTSKINDNNHVTKFGDDTIDKTSNLSNSYVKKPLKVSTSNDDGVNELSIDYLTTNDEQQKENVPQQKENVLQQKENAPQQKENVLQQKENAPQQKENVLQQKENVSQQKENAPQQSSSNFLVKSNCKNNEKISNTSSFFDKSLLWLKKDNVSTLSNDGDCNAKNNDNHHVRDDTTTTNASSSSICHHDQHNTPDNDDSSAIFLTKTRTTVNRFRFDASSDNENNNNNHTSHSHRIKNHLPIFHKDDSSFSSSSSSTKRIDHVTTKNQSIQQIEQLDKNTTSCSTIDSERSWMYRNTKRLVIKPESIIDCSTNTNNNTIDTSKSSTNESLKDYGSKFVHIENCRTTLTDRLKNLMAAKRTAHLLPDKGLRLESKILQVTKELEEAAEALAKYKLEAAPISLLTSNVVDDLCTTFDESINLSKNAEISLPSAASLTQLKLGRLFPPVLSQEELNRRRLEHMYSIDDNNKKQWSIGGGFKNVKNVEIKAMTDAVVQHLHNALSQRPSETDQLSQPPIELKATLLPHQLQAIKWLQWRENQTPSGGILADDMGLGKTLTMIAFTLFQNGENLNIVDCSDQNLIPSKSTLVVCPLSMIHTWESELKKHVKSGVLTCAIYHGPKKEKLPNLLAKYDFVLTSYPSLASEVGACEDSKVDTKENEKCQLAAASKKNESVERKSNNVKRRGQRNKNKKENSSILLQIGWRRVILDEGHHIKNYKCLTARSCCRVSAASRWILTGTPLHNRKSELYSYCKFLRLDPFDDWNTWNRLIESNGIQSSTRLNLIIQTILLRRTKDQKCTVTGDPLVHLPNKTIITHPVELLSTERRIYDRIFQHFRNHAREFVLECDRRQSIAQGGHASDFVEKFNNDTIQTKNSVKANKKDLFKIKQTQKKTDGQETEEARLARITRTRIFAYILRLRQVCCHLALMKQAVDISAFDDLYEADKNTVTADDLLQQMEDLTVNDLTQNLDDNVENKIMLNETENEKGVEKMFQPDYISTKIGLMLDRINEIIFSDDKSKFEKIVVVSHWTSLLDIVKLHLDKQSISFTSITGTVKPEDRAKRVVEFNQTLKGPRVMLLSLAAGGVGLSLIGANHLILLDMSWNPALENQAFDRIHRLGQTKDVYIHKFVFKDTIEERIQQLQNYKLNLQHEILSKGTDSSSLSVKDIRFLFKL